MRESGCRQLLIGLESPRQTGLDGVELRRNWKMRVLPDYERRLAAIHAAGITVNGCFVLGLDGDGPDVFEAVYEFVERVGLNEVQLSVLTPFPGTPLYRRLLAEGRLIRPRDWRTCTLFDVNYRPQKLKIEQLESGLINLAKRIFAPDAVERRRRRFFEQRMMARIDVKREPTRF